MDISITKVKLVWIGKDKKETIVDGNFDVVLRINKELTICIKEKLFNG